MAGLATNRLHLPPDAKRKSMKPLENNPQVMSDLAYRLGLSKNLRFEDVYGIDDPELISMIRRPCLAVLLVFPISETYENYRIQEDEKLDEYSGSGEDEDVIWFKQTIGTACGLIGLLHSICNGDARSFIQPGSELARILDLAVPLSPIPRANVLCDSQALEEANDIAATSGDTEVIAANTPMDLHFVCFTKSKKKLFELDGRRKGPISRGTLEEDEDVLSDKALDLGVRAFLAQAKEQAEDIRFSLIALTPVDLDN